MCFDNWVFQEQLYLFKLQDSISLVNVISQYDKTYCQCSNMNSHLISLKFLNVFVNSYNILCFVQLILIFSKFISKSDSIFLINFCFLFFFTSMIQVVTMNLNFFLEIFYHWYHVSFSTYHNNISHTWSFWRN